MINLAVIALALLFGYVLTVGCSLMATFGIASAAPAFVSKNHRITSGYKRLYALVWLLCAAVGAFGSAGFASISRINPWAIGAALGAVLIGMLWFNSWEARQRGMAHQILLTLTTAAGVILGAWSANRFISLQ